jgi:HAD superfamily hydrolase (TIGR01509 family)
MIPSPLEAVIFDMDGLLLDTETLYREASDRACRTLGIAMPDAVYLSLIGTPKEVGDALLCAHFGEGFEVAHYDRIFDDHWRDVSRNGIPLKTGAVNLLDLLSAQGVPYAVATSTARPTAEKHLRHVGVFDRLGALVTRTDVTRGKPHPETFLKAAEGLGARPAYCLALEDSFNGVRAASAAGMATVMIPDLLTPTDDIRMLCAGVLPSLAEVARELETRFSLGQT